MAHTNVLVVGAGPVGLMLAAELHRHGVNVRIIDSAPPRPDHESRALGVHTRTLEAFERLGADVIARFLAEGVRAQAANFYGRGSHLVRIPLERIDTPFPFSLLLGQAVTERLLIEHLQRCGVLVQRPVRLVDVRQGSTEVTATLDFGDGHTELATAAYLVGADGAHSAVRRLVGQRFAGRALDGHYLLADARPRWHDGQSWADDEIHTVMRPDAGMLIFGPLPGGGMRFVVSADQSQAPVGGVALGTVQALVDSFRPDVQVTLDDMVWSSYFAISSRVVDRMRVGRVFLAGDAAHIHSPESGQGMNAGIQDAINLAWKLALRLKGLGSEALLDSYHAERHPVVVGIVRTTEYLERALELTNPVLAGGRDRLLAFAGRFERFRDAMANAFSANSYHYRKSPIVESRSSRRRPPRPGERAPDAVGITTSSAAPRRLFEIWGSDPRSKLLVFPGVDPSPESQQALAALTRRIDLEFGEFVDARLATLAQTPLLPSEIVGSAGELHRRYHVSGETLVLVRPDGYVGLRSEPTDETVLRRHLGQTLGLRATHSSEPAGTCHGR